MVAHALQDAPNECCGVLGTKDGDAVKLYRATNIARQPAPLPDRRPGAAAHLRRRRGFRPGDGADLPLAHAQRAVSVADRCQPRHWMAGRAVRDRRDRHARAGGPRLLRSATARSPTASWKSADPWAFGSRRARSSAPAVARGQTPASASARHVDYRSCSVSWRRPKGVRRRCPSAARERARSSRSWPKVTWSASPTPATSPRPSSSRACCWRRGCRACCAVAPASTCPTCSPPARATSWSPARGWRPPARSCSRPR